MVFLILMAKLAAAEVTKTAAAETVKLALKWVFDRSVRGRTQGKSLPMDPPNAT